MTAAATTLTLHASAVVWHGRGVLLRGASGSGKSALALRLLQAGARLVADDLVTVSAERGRLIACSPRPSGLIEARGLGIFHLAAAATAPLALAVDLMPSAVLERLPEVASETLLGITLPRIALDAGVPGAPALVLLALTARRAG